MEEETVGNYLVFDGAASIPSTVQKETGVRDPVGAVCLRRVIHGSQESRTEGPGYPRQGGDPTMEKLEWGWMEGFTSSLRVS